VRRRDATPTHPSTADVDFDFGRAADARARRRTAERLGGSATSARRTPTATDASARTHVPAAARLSAAGSATPTPRAHDGADLAPVPLAPPPARRQRRPRGRHLASQPDRIALWAVVLGILLIALAAASSRADAATPAAWQAPAALERTVAPAAGDPAPPAHTGAPLAD
jgi:hypothetical protein